MSFTEDIYEIVEQNGNGLLGIPPHWRRVRLWEIGTVLNGYPFESRRFSRERGIPLIRIRDVVPGNTETRFDGDYPGEYLIRRGDLLVGMDGDFNSAFWAGPDGLLNQRVSKIRINECLYDRRFLGYSLPGYLNAINDRTSSITVKHLSSQTLLDIPLPLPPLAEQTRIADRIDELFTDLAAGVAALERVKRNLSRYRAAALHAAVTGRLTEAWRKQHGTPAEPGPKLLERILAERRRQWERRTLAKYEKDGKQPPKNWRDRYPEPSPPKLPADGSPLPVLPEGWCWVSVDQVTQIIQYGTSAKTNEDASGVPVLRMGNITTKGTVDYTNLKYLPQDHHEFPELLLERGDVLFNRTNSAELVGKTAVFEPTTDGRYSLASYLIRVRAVAGCSPRWLTWCVISPLGRRWLRSVLSHTAGQANVNGTKLAEYVIPLPPAAEQAAIVDGVNEKLSQIDGLEAEIVLGLARAARLRQAILKAAFEGKLVPQDPADEPASALLARISRRVETGDDLDRIQARVKRRPKIASSSSQGRQRR